MADETTPVVEEAKVAPSSETPATSAPAAPEAVTKPVEQTEAEQAPEKQFEERRKQSRLQRRFDSYTREIRGLQATVAGLEQKLSGATPASQAGQVQPAPAPVQPQYEAEASYWESLEAAKAVYPDYDATIAKAQRLPVGPALAQAIKASDMAGDVLYYLAKNPTEALDLNGLDAYGAAREIGRIEARIELTRQSPSTKAVSRAPAPVKPVQGGAEGVERDINQLSMADHMRAVRERKKR